MPGSPSPPPSPPTRAIIIGDPHVLGFDRQWFQFDGYAGGRFNLLATGSGTRLAATFGAGGLKGRSTFVRGIQLNDGRARVKALLRKQGKRWVLVGEYTVVGGQPGACAGAGACPAKAAAATAPVHICSCSQWAAQRLTPLFCAPACVLAVYAGGKRMGRNATKRLPGRVTVRTVPKFRDTGRPMVTITTPSLRIEAKQRRPQRPAQKADPLYGEWLDVFITVLRPLPLPVTGLVGE